MHRLQERRPVAPLTGETARPGEARRRRLLALGVAALVLALDQVTKSLAVHDLSNGPVHVLGPISLELSYNTGVAFSIGTGLVLPIVLVVVTLVGVVAFLGRYAPGRTGAFATGMVLGGALGNLSDRLFRHDGGAVVDFIATRFWPTFNVADASIVVGSVLLGIVLLRGARRVSP